MGFLFLMMNETTHSKCGICVAHTLHDVYSFVKDLQHRGREACGIFAVGETIDVIKWSGPVSKVDLIDLHKIFPASKYHVYGAHVRYATKGREDKILEDAHPHVIGGKVELRGDHIIIRDCEAVAIHNGQVNFNQNGSRDFECDTKKLLRYYKKYGEKNLMKNITGAYTLAIAEKGRKEVVILRDRTGIKPGCLGLKDGKYCVASEDIAFKENGAKFIEDLDPGTIYYIYDNGSYKKTKVITPNIKHCFFEWNYVADARSVMNGLSVLRIRHELGRTLAEEFCPGDIEVITFLPRCPENAARAYAKHCGKENKFRPVFYKLRSERAFQGTNKADRENSIKSNLHLLPGIEKVLKGKVIACIDDSTIRGNNAKHARDLFKKSGAKKIYFLNYTPRIGIIGSEGRPRGCMFGVDMPPNDDFIVRTKDKTQNRGDSEISQEIGMEVYFLSVEGMFRAFERAGMQRENLCCFCIGGKHPFI
jgi:amidophosphoribosyltransferase